jgi:predicted tellurium resistance membrane protein TerC
VERVNELVQQIIDHPFASLIVVGNLIIIESLLSVDNAAVLATMVMDLPAQQRDKALKYGIIGAYVFRGLCLIFAAFLIQIWWLKPLGGIYLLWLAVDQFKNSLRYGETGSLIFKIASLLGFLFLVQAQAPVVFGGISFDIFAYLIRPLIGIGFIFLAYSLFKVSTDEDDDGEINKSNNAIYRFFYDRVGLFWSTVVLVEIMDLAFSIDNVFAAVAYSRNIIIVCLGVFIGILAMRFVAQWFVRLIEKYAFLETCAFIVIAILGVKLSMAIYTHSAPCSPFSIFWEGNHACLQAQGVSIAEGQHEVVYGDAVTSILTISIFLLPILFSMLFKREKK